MEPDAFERYGLDLTEEEKAKLLEIASVYYANSGGAVGLWELLAILEHPNRPRCIVASIDVPGSPFE
jgi:hypothetical protein